MFIFFSNGNGSAFENSLDSGYPFASVPVRCTKTTLLEMWKRRRAETVAWDYDTTERSFNAVSTLCKGEVRRSPEQSARPSAAADSEEWQICTTGLFAESFGLCLCFLPSCAMYKDNAVANVVAETGRDLVFMTTARLSDLSMPLKGEIRCSTWTVCRAADSEERKICTTSLFAESVGLWKDDGLVCFLPSWSTPLVERGLGEDGIFDVAARSETPKPTCRNHKQQQLRPLSGPRKGAQTRTTQVKVQQVLSKYREKESN